MLTQVRGATRETILCGALFEEVPSVFPAKTLYSPSKTFEGVMIARGRSLYRSKTDFFFYTGATGAARPIQNQAVPRHVCFVVPCRGDGWSPLQKFIPLWRPAAAPTKIAVAASFLRPCQTVAATTTTAPRRLLRARARDARIYKVDFVGSSSQKTQCKQCVTPCFAFSVCRRCTLSTRRSRKSGSAWGADGKKRGEIASRP